MNTQIATSRRWLIALVVGVLVLNPPVRSAEPARSQHSSAVSAKAVGAGASALQPAAVTGSRQAVAAAEPRRAITPGIDAAIAPAPKPPCGPALVRRIRHNTVEATKSDPEVTLECSLTLPSTAFVTKRLVLAGSASSGVIVQCSCDANRCTTLDGDILFAAFDTDRPENITVRNCRITGDVRIGAAPAASQTRRRDFEAWIRARAPRRITFDNVNIAGSGHDRFYVNWGVTDTKLINSVIEGEASGVPIYLAPHSSRTLIKNNQIRTVTTAPGITKTTERESIAIDGSDHNQIISNWFGALNRGGIYLYRNCGENRGIRHTTPSHNHIINNVFLYRSYDGPNPAVYLGSRDGDPPRFHIGGWRNYCDDDAGFPWGSSADDQDFATHNVVMGNLIVKRPEAEVIRSKDWVNNAMNLIDRNVTVPETRAKWPRPPAGCYVRGGDKEFIRHLETTEMFMRDDGSPTCERVTCNDGELHPAILQQRATSACATRRVPIDCPISGTNKGCERRVACPAGTRIVGAVAACNLEQGAVSDDELATVPPNLIHVARLSDGIKGGSCHIENNRVIGKISRFAQGGVMRVVVPPSAVQTPIRNIAGLIGVTAGCNEHDDNGGDCHIRGSLFCR